MSGLTRYDSNDGAVKYFSVTDEDFVVGDSPVTLDINSTLTQNSVTGEIINDGKGDFIINISVDGAIFQDDILIKEKEIFSLEGIDVDSIMITWVSNSAYRVFAT